MTNNTQGEPIAVFPDRQHHLEHHFRGAKCGGDGAKKAKTTCGSKYTQLLKGILHSNTIDSFVMRKVVFGKKVAEYDFDPKNFTFKKRGTSSEDPKTVSSAYNGNVTIPTTGDMLIATVYYGGTTPVQFAIYDAKNETEQSFMAKNMSNDFTVSMFFDRVNGGRFDVARTSDPYSVNAFFSILCYYGMLNTLFKGRVGLPNKSHTLVSISNVRFTNAFWTGYCMVFGNGKDSRGKVLPLTSMDVCGHELSHGLQTFTTEFEYQGESGALNESIADVFGTFLELYVNSPADQPDWTLGEQFRYIIRDFKNPKAYQQPCYYGGQFWINPSTEEDNGGVHVNSGVTNYLCYLSVEGAKNFKCENGVQMGDLISVNNFTLKEYTESVYDVIFSKKLPISAGLKEFAKELRNTIKNKFDEKVLSHYVKCCKAVGLLEGEGMTSSSFNSEEDGDVVNTHDDVGDDEEGTYEGGGNDEGDVNDEEGSCKDCGDGGGKEAEDDLDDSISSPILPDLPDIEDDNEHQEVPPAPSPSPFPVPPPSPVNVPAPPQQKIPVPIPPVPSPPLDDLQEKAIVFKRATLELLSGYVYYSQIREAVNSVRLHFDAYLLSLASTNSPVVISFWFHDVNNLNIDETRILSLMRNTPPSFEKVLERSGGGGVSGGAFSSSSRRQEVAFEFSSPSRVIIGFSCILSPWLVPEGSYKMIG